MNGVGDKGKNTQNLKDISALISGLEHFIFFGTLLGYERERGIIEGDDDIDIYVCASEKKQLVELISSSNFHIDMRLRCNKSPHFLQARRTLDGIETFVDFYFYENEKHLSYILERWNFRGKWKSNENALHIPKNLIFPLSKKPFEDFEVKLPADPAGCCEYLYGPTWKTPQKKNSEYRIVVKDNVPKLVSKVGASVESDIAAPQLKPNGEVLGKVRRFQGRLLIVAFDHSKPNGWGAEGVTLRIQRQDQILEGIVLPVGSSNRIVMRMDRDISGWASQDDVLVSYVRPAADADADEIVLASNVTLIDKPLDAALDFSIFTFVRDVISYNRMLKSYADYGFTTENTEFIAIDHRKVNMMNGYQLSRFAQARSKGRYVILCHDDIELLQNSHSELLSRLGELTETDPLWMIAGVAGGVYGSGSTSKPKKVASRISDRWGPGRRVHGPFPRLVESLDECFLIMPKSRMPQSTLGLEGFHFFGTDLCLQAELAGGAAYVIDFHLFHYGRAHMGAEYGIQKNAIEQHYGKIWPGRVVGTSTKPLSF